MYSSSPRPESRNALDSRSPSRQALDSRPQSRNALAPHSRSTSQEFINYFTNSRPQSSLGFDRPASRNALNVVSIQEPSRLTAQEQEYIARATGTPLLGHVGKDSNRLSQTGLLAAMEAREREKQEIKETRTNYVVQQAVQQRQFLHQRTSSQNLLSQIPGSFPMTPPVQSQQQQQQGYWQSQNR